jgi:predicted HicB family RNase H-like nuclease
MARKPERQAVGIRIDRDLLHQAKIAAVIQGKTLGKWLEEAIEEKVGREREEERREAGNDRESGETT